MKPTLEKPVIGWRQWVALPALDIERIKTKVDTRARTSCLHAIDVETYYRHGTQRVRFKVHPQQRDTHRTVACDARLIEHRWVTSSSGKRSLRPVVLTPIRLMGQRWEIELTLTNRDAMGFRMLLGREAVRGRFLADPGRSFLGEAGDRKAGGRKTGGKTGRHKKHAAARRPHAKRTQP